MRRQVTPRRAVIGAVLIVIAALAAWWLWPSDSAKPVSRSTAGPYLVALRVDSPHTGDNTVDLDVTDQQGNVVAPDRISVEPAMPQMGHALPPSPAAAAVTPGHYRATVNLPMPGQWEIAVKLSGAPGTGSATFSVQAN
ncbi:FixH family protein [Nocardia yunnanensis]|uniref:FixH family protein n=1 Tax=Nocardia yunnanensis TaxID=2382165 RepID=UPI001CA3EC27|nr:FixH family protein [Nocardia yunnanensis]